MTEAAPRLKILFTNISLRGRSGTEMMTAELAIALHRRGHEVTIYSPRIGLLARDIMARGVAVTDQIAQLTTVPDIIHGHHNTALATAMVRFPASRAIFVCHDSAMGYDAPVIDPRIGAYVAVDAACAARLGVAGVTAADIALLPNAVDLAAFPLRARIADQPASALAITKTLAPWLDAARLACELAGLAFEAVGPGAGGSVSDLASRIAKADIVFAWSRSAAEAAASGAAVIMCDEFGFGGMLTAAQAEAYPAGPLGRRILSHAATPDAMTNAIAAYHAADIARTAVVVRKKLSLEHMLTRYEALYRDVLAQPPVGPGETAGLAAFIASAMPRFDLPAEIEVAQEALAARLIRLDAWIAGQAVPPASIQFSQAGLGAALLGDGWGPPEDWGAWTIARRARLDLPVAMIKAWGGRIGVTCQHFKDGGETIRAVEVFFRNRLLARWHFSPLQSAAPLLLAIPAELIAAENHVVELTFHILHPGSPLGSGTGEDARELGLALMSACPWTGS